MASSYRRDMPFNAGCPDALHFLPGEADSTHAETLGRAKLLGRANRRSSRAPCSGESEDRPDSIPRWADRRLVGLTSYNCFPAHVFVGLVVLFGGPLGIPMLAPRQ